MIITSAIFVKSAVKPAQYPAPSQPEIAFAGRSNVGKSSLINTLIRRKRLVKTSKTPGRTQLINFFLINDRVMFVDLPGYGYAKVPAAVKTAWQPMIETYLRTRSNLKGVVLIMDIRRSPGNRELNFGDWLRRAQIPFLRVLTKSDKLSRNKQTGRRAAMAKAWAADPADFILFSAKTGSGFDPLWLAIDDLLSSATK